MCGICGTVNLRGQLAEAAILTSMRERLHHRGPDEAGQYISGGVGLAMRRLSIIDLAGGSQPIYNEDHTVAIVFNGELYNFPILRPRLEALGHRFYTNSDTEVVVHAYEQWGLDCLAEFNGMFAFALWDSRTQRLVMARDRLGIKPLYYTVRGDTLIFASELKAILAHPQVERRVDPLALYEYLSFEYVPTPRSIIADVWKLPPGHCLVFDRAGLACQQYWQLDLTPSEAVRPSDVRQQAALLLEQLRAAVRLELIADVPVGVLLSGGIDSSSVAALMAEIAPGRVQSFSVGMEDPSFDESDWAQRAATFIGTEHHALTVTARDMLDVIPRLGVIMDEPLGDASLIPTYLVAQFARQFVKVALGGDGGDELFGGYSTLQAHRLAQWYVRLTPEPLRAATARLTDRVLPSSFDNISLDFKLRRFFESASLPPGIRHHRWLGSFTPDQKAKLLQPGLLPGRDITYSVVEHHWNRCAAHELFNKVMYCDLKLYLEGDILPKVDRASMACSLEVRVPLLNAGLVAHVSALPHALKLKGLTTKYLLRRALAGRVPSEILRRGKKGFGVPVAKWLVGELRECAGDLLSPAAIHRQGYFRAEYVQQLWQEHQSRRRDHRKLLWTLLAFQLWFDTYMKGA
jgi:asparagine synthase (glutamine-hydrolysing)